MATSKKSASKSTAKSDSNSSQSEGQVEARPIGQGKDPLAEGNTLVNPSNTEAETHYDVKQTSEEASKIDGQDANQRAEQHNTELTQGAPDHETPNHDQTDQDEAAEGRTEESAAAAK